MNKNDLFPWYRVIWNILCMPIIVIGAFFYCLGIMLQHLKLNAFTVMWKEMFSGMY